ncbi:unnamed protein product [Lactuca virosa]|uniref:Uncharacterized protein n=1 Tax=Lactuca virosa TaxID=75947 RepID=A0AAU9NTV0_9ASTR|nr:unnamed protein product [Lactuca virosa]
MCLLLKAKLQPASWSAYNHRTRVTHLQPTDERACKDEILVVFHSELAFAFSISFPTFSKGFRISETNTTTRRSFSGNPFTRPNTVVNPRCVNPPTPTNTPATTDHTKRGSVLRKSTGSSMFQDGKENHKDIVRSPARSYEKSFMAPTISAASKFTPSPRKKVLGVKNEVTSIQFLDKDFVMKSEATLLDQPVMTEEDSNESITLEQKKLFLKLLLFVR